MSTPEKNQNTVKFKTKYPLLDEGEYLLRPEDRNNKRLHADFST